MTDEWHSRYYSSQVYLLYQKYFQNDEHMADIDFEQG
jgi:hypothetical protein